MSDLRNSGGYVDAPPPKHGGVNGYVEGSKAKSGCCGKFGFTAILLFMLVAAGLSLAAVVLAGDKLLENLNGEDNEGGITGSPTTLAPSSSPTASPTLNPTVPTTSPTFNPTSSPIFPTVSPTLSPTIPTTSPTNNPTLSPTPPTVAPTSAPTSTQVQFLGTPETVFQDQPGDLISLVFTQDVSDETEIVNAFSNAARRWSDVLAGTEYGSFRFSAEEELCTGITGSSFSEAETITSLHIVARFAEIDQVGLILGSAGPCFFASATLRTVTGQMLFDLFDVDDLISDGSFESVVLHEMGHVLGIGTSWRNFNLLDNPVFVNNVVVNTEIQPGFIGSRAIEEYSLLTGNNESFVPVEDGVFEGIERFDRDDNEGEGSIDGHWDKDFFEGELMEFQIASGATPPMSRTTIASLGDLGYAINLTLAEDYTPPVSTFASKLRGTTPKMHSMVSDIDYSFLKFV